MCKCVRDEDVFTFEILPLMRIPVLARKFPGGLDRRQPALVEVSYCKDARRDALCSLLAAAADSLVATACGESCVTSRTWRLRDFCFFLAPISQSCCTQTQSGPETRHGTAQSCSQAKLRLFGPLRSFSPRLAALTCHCKVASDNFPHVPSRFARWEYKFSTGPQ